MEEAPSSRCTPSTVSTAIPSNEIRMSPARSPARAAGLSGITSINSTPVFCDSPWWRARRRSIGRVCAARPRTPRRTRPCCISSPRTQRAVSIGTEKLRPWAPRITAVLIPTTRAWLSTSGPPLLPGFRATSLWMMASIRRPSWARKVRPRALTTPALTVKEKPRGLPIATTSCPTRSFELVPSSAAGRCAPSMCTTARSVAWSVPTTFPSWVDPSGSPILTLPARPTTCALVSR